MAASRAALSFATACAIACAASAAGPASASTPGLVVDAASGRVLFAERATDPWFPASVTKLMTVYVALDQIRQGRASMDMLLAMGPDAASQPPSKIGLKVGMTMTLENAMKIIMVKSANDIAHMIGENLGGGTVEGFATLMNDAARRLGMRESRWTNPSGLPDSRQQTSARDMAVLARALITEFPEHEHLFRIGAVKLGAKIMRNHNGMLGRYPGADGMKTGFICSGGFNIVASATQNGRRVIAVVFGYPSARERDLRTADLFDAGFSSLGWGAQPLDQLPPSASMEAPDMRPIVCGAKRRQPAEDDETAVVATNPSGDNPISAFFTPSAFAAAPGSAPALGSRRTLGPRVAFAPIPVWVGPTPTATDEGGEVSGKPVRLAARPVKTKPVGRTGLVPASATAFASPVPSPVAADGPSIETLKASPRPSSRAALRANLDAKRSAGEKPKTGAGAIAAAAAAKPDAKAAGRKAAAKPASQTAQAKTAKPARTAAPAAQ